MGDLAKLLIMAGCALIFCGIAITVIGKIPGAGKLPGDILIKRENLTIYFPIVTCLVISLILSLLFFLWNQK